jgi:hypothetical protein
MMRTERIMAVWLVLVVCSSAWALDANDPNLVSYWMFDEGSGATALDYAGDNNGTVHGATWTTGQIEGALSFDGIDDYVDVDDDPSLRFSQHDSFTISYWALPISDEHGGWVVCKMQPSAQSHCFTYETEWNSSISAFGFTISRANSSSWVPIHTIAGSAPAGSWYHVAAVYDNRDMKIYLNGQLNVSGIFPYHTDSTPSDNSMAIGARLIISTFESGTFFDGQIDEVAIYDRALSAEEVQQLYYEGFSDYERAIVLIEDALAEKEEALEASLRAVEKEWLAYESLEELLESGDYGDLSKRDIVIAKQDIHSAIQHEWQSMKSLERSIKRLMYSLAGLGEEAEPNQISE